MVNNTDTDVLKVVGINSKGYGIFPKLVAKDRRLTPESKAIYAYFCSYAGAGSKAFPQVATILYDLGMSENRYYKHFKLLVHYGFISVEQIRTKGKFNHNLYTMNTEISFDSFGDTKNQPGIKNKGTVKNSEPSLYSSCTKKPSTEKSSLENGGININNSNINSPNINNSSDYLSFQETKDDEVRQDLFGGKDKAKKKLNESKLFELANKLGATHEELDKVLKIFDQACEQIRYPEAWLKRALENTVKDRSITQELAARSKRTKNPKEKNNANYEENVPPKDKYENFYL